MPPSRAGERLEAGIFKPLNASFSSRGRARGRDLHSSCRSRRIGYTALADSATGKGHLHNLHSKMVKNLAHKYLQLPAMARKSCKTPNLRRIYKNSREFTPLFKEFTKIYVNLQRKLLRPPALPPFVVGLPPVHSSMGWPCAHWKNSDLPLVTQQLLYIPYILDNV